jgi:pyruvate formate lyase activating enzyme
MCGWLAANAGVDCPLHFSRFIPQHRLTYLPPTPVDTLLAARQLAKAEGLRYVYVGNAPGTPDVQDTVCPSCGKVVIARSTYAVLGRYLKDGRCAFCRALIPGVWS